MAGFMPSSESEKRKWLLSLKGNLPIAERQLNLSPQTVQYINDNIDNSIQNIDNVSQKDLDLAASQEKRNEDRNVFFPELNKIVKRWKNDANYSRSLGEQLGIEPNTAAAPKSVEAQKNFKVDISSIGQEVQFVFKKAAGYGVVIYSRRGNETDFTLLKQVEGKTYKDTRPILGDAVAEKREYYFTLIKNDIETSQTAVYKVGTIK